MNIAAYCRVSTEKEDQLNSLEAQKQFFAEYTKKTGDTLVKLYADEGISGTKIKNRKEFLRMMSDAEHGIFDMVVVKDISRFARNTVDLLQNVRKLKALGIETQFLTANMTSMGNSEFVLTIFGALAQEESANTSKRVKFGKKMNAEKGLDGKIFTEFVALILISHLDHKMKKSDLYKKYTLHQLLDELDVIECFEDANHSLRIGELLNKQAKIYEDLGVKIPTSSC